jgi:hypothetical protein
MARCNQLPLLILAAVPFLCCVAGTPKASHLRSISLYIKSIYRHSIAVSSSFAALILHTYRLALCHFHDLGIDCCTLRLIDSHPIQRGPPP